MVASSKLPVGAEGEGIDGISMVQGVEVLAIIEVPQHGLGVLAAGSAEGTVGGHGDRVQVAGVADVVGLQLAVGQVPHLDVLVPPSGDDDWVLVVGGEPDAGDPVLVAVLLDRVLALGKGVPQLREHNDEFHVMFEFSLACYKLLNVVMPF